MATKKNLPFLRKGNVQKLHNAKGEGGYARDCVTLKHTKHGLTVKVDKNCVTWEGGYSKLAQISVM